MSLASATVKNLSEDTVATVTTKQLKDRVFNVYQKKYRHINNEPIGQPESIKKGVIFSESETDVKSSRRQICYH